MLQGGQEWAVLWCHFSTVGERTTKCVKNLMFKLGTFLRQAKMANRSIKTITGW